MQAVPDNLFESAQTVKKQTFHHFTNIDKEAEEFLRSVCFLVNVRMGRDPLCAKETPRAQPEDTGQNVSKAS